MRPETIVKLIVLAFIVAVPFVKVSHAALDTIAAKLVMLAIIAATSFYNLEIAILLTVLFFMLIIVSNNNLINSKTQQKKEPFVMTEFPESSCPLVAAPQPTPNPYPFFVDDKVKPYEEYIKRIGVPSDS